MTLLLLNQYFDTLKDIATKGDCRVVFTPPTGEGFFFCMYCDLYF